MGTTGRSSPFEGSGKDPIPCTVSLPNDWLSGYHFHAFRLQNFLGAAINTDPKAFQSGRKNTMFLTWCASCRILETFPCLCSCCFRLVCGRKAALLICPAEVLPYEASSTHPP